MLKPLFISIVSDLLKYPFSKSYLLFYNIKQSYAIK